MADDRPNPYAMFPGDEERAMRAAWPEKPKELTEEGLRKTTTEMFNRGFVLPPPPPVHPKKAQMPTLADLDGLLLNRVCKDMAASFREGLAKDGLCPQCGCDTGLRCGQVCPVCGFKLSCSMEP